MLAELLAVDGVIRTMLLPGWLSPLDLIRLRGVSSPLRALANSALAGLPPLAMLGAQVDKVVEVRHRETSQLAMLANDAEDDDGDDDFEPFSEDDGEMEEQEASDDDEREACDVAASPENDDEGEAVGGAEDQTPPLQLHGFVMCWSSGHWMAAPPLNCALEQPLEDCRCHVLGPAPGATASRPVQWPPARECVVLPQNCRWAADYSPASTSEIVGAAHVIGAPLRHEGARGWRADGATILRGQWPTREREGERLIFMLGGYFEPFSLDSEEDEEEEGHSALVEYFPLDAQDEGSRHWTRIASMKCQRTEFAAGFFPAGSYFADSLARRSACGDSDKSSFVLIAAGGSDGSSDEEYLRSAECNVCVDVGGALESSSWLQLPDMLRPRGYCTGCVLPDGRFVVMGGRSRRTAGPARRRDGEVFDPTHYRWRMLPPLPTVFGESPELTLCAGGPSLLVAAMAVPTDIGEPRYVAALQLAATHTETRLGTHDETEGRDDAAHNACWQALVAQAVAKEHWVTLGSLPQGDGGFLDQEVTSLVCTATQ